MRAQFGGVSNVAMEAMREHHEAHGKHREPLLDGLSSNCDVKLFREAQAVACEDKVCQKLIMID